MRRTGVHNFPAIDRVIYGKAASAALNEEAERLNAKRVFLLASRTLNTKTDEIEKIRRALGDKHVATFDGIAQHTTRKQAAEVARQANDARADLIVAVGGGSAIDLAKIVIMAMEHDIRDEAGFDPFPMGPGVNYSPFRSPGVRQIAIPSTLNGGEYNAAALVTDERHKLHQPDDLEARRLSQYGSWLASFGLQARVPMGASHGIGHVLGGTFEVPHYYCTPVIMPSLLRYNKPFTEDAQKRLATALGAPDVEAADAFAEFTNRLGLPGRLADVGIGEDKFDQISKIAINHRFVQANPRPFKSEADIVDLLRMAA
jgi:alcohol dehydrogenase class IV